MYVGRSLRYNEVVPIHARTDSLTTHICIVPILRNSGVIPPLNLSSSMARIGTTSLYLNLLPTYIKHNPAPQAFHKA
jgi:hypothetical protein